MSVIRKIVVKMLFFYEIDNVGYLPSFVGICWFFLFLKWMATISKTLGDQNVGRKRLVASDQQFQDQLVASD